MVIGIIGESCTGKSTLASALRQAIGGEVVTGRDYLRLAKSESEAIALFKAKLQEAMTGAHVLYVISEREHLALLPPQALKVLVTADLTDIKERFSRRMHGHLPAPVEQMLDQKHGMFDGEACSIRYHSSSDQLDDAVAAIVHELSRTAG